MTPEKARLDWADFSYFLEVARTERLGEAARRLGVDYTTVSRRIRALEAALGTLLFDKSRSSGFVLTTEGKRLLSFAETMERTVDGARDEIGGDGQALEGRVRMGSTEGFGIFFIAPRMAGFRARYPHLEVDMLPVPRTVSLSKREADLAITIERPERGPYVCSKLCDYHLRLYGSADYLKSHPVIVTPEDLGRHEFIGYIDELVYSNELLYLERYVPKPRMMLRSTSVSAQYQAVRQGMGLSILPCFIADTDPTLVPILRDEIVVERSFWIYCHEDLRKLRRVVALWDYMRQVVAGAQAQAVLLGLRVVESAER